MKQYGPGRVNTQKQSLLSESPIPVASKSSLFASHPLERAILTAITLFLNFGPCRVSQEKKPKKKKTREK
jgi:hypothetical protein